MKSKTSKTSKKPKKSKPLNPRSKAFLRSYQWKSFRLKALERDGHRCALCGASNGHTALTVHHIIERRQRPDLALELPNVITLCTHCHFLHHHHESVVLHAWLALNRSEQWDWICKQLFGNKDI